MRKAVRMAMKTDPRTGRMRGTRNMRKKMMLMRVSTILIPVRGEAARIIY